MRVYYNLHKKCLSVMDKKTRLVIAHVDSIQLDDVRFIVSAKGLARLRKRRRKSVIAFVEGDYSMAYGKWGDCDKWPQAYFDPYKVDQFMMGEEPIYKADRVRIENKNIYIKEKNA